MSPLICKKYGIQNLKKEQKFYQNKLDDAWTKHTLVQDNAKAHKKEFLNKKCEEARSQGDKPKAEKLRAIISSEYSAWLWPKLR